MIIHQLAVNHDLITNLDVGLACLVLLVAKVQDAEAVELTRLRAISGDVERGIAISAALGEGALVCDTGDLALYIDIVGLVVSVVVGPGQILDGIDRSCRVVRIIQRTRTTGVPGRRSRRSGRRVTAILGLPVQGIQIGLTGHCLRRIVTIIHQLAVNHDLITDLYVGLSRLVLLVAKVQDTEAVELTRL